jgi:hypothetical protein
MRHPSALFQIDSNVVEEGTNPSRAVNLRGLVASSITAKPFPEGLVASSTPVNPEISRSTKHERCRPAKVLRIPPTSNG